MMSLFWRPPDTTIVNDRITTNRLVLRALHWGWTVGRPFATFAFRLYTMRHKYIDLGEALTSERNFGRTYEHCGEDVRLLSRQLWMLECSEIVQLYVHRE